MRHFPQTGVYARWSNNDSNTIHHWIHEASQIPGVTYADQMAWEAMEREIDPLYGVDGDLDGEHEALKLAVYDHILGVLRRESGAYDMWWRRDGEKLILEKMQ